jgi:hypothetical protein
MAQEECRQTLWVGIPSIPAHRVGQAFATFFVAIALSITIDVLLIIHNHKPGTWQLTVERVFDDGSSIVAWALAATWPLMEVVRMVLAGLWEKRILRRGRAEGRKENQQLWEAWNERRLRAEEQGEPFHEPPPGSAPNNDA